MKKNLIYRIILTCFIFICLLFSPLFFNNVTCFNFITSFSLVTSFWQFLILLLEITSLILVLVSLFLTPENKAVKSSIFASFLLFGLCPFNHEFFVENSLKTGPFSFMAIFLGLLNIAKFCFKKENAFLLSIKDITEIAIFSALAIILDMPFCKIHIMQAGGSISLTMVPLLILSLRKGFEKGFIGCGLIFAIVTCFLDGYGFYSFVFDYLLAFGSLAIIGLFKKVLIVKNNRLKFINYIFLALSIIFCVTFRTLFATISGIIFYGLTFWPSLVYQLTYILPSSILTLIVMLLLYYPINRFTKD